MIYFTSDLHLYHKNILEFCKDSRPFNDLDAMHESLRNHWNGLVNSDDTVYILGDVSFGDIQQTIKYLDSLNGKKILIYGNHDHKIRRNDHNIQDCFDGCFDMLEITIDKKLYVLNHYPMVVWNRSHYGSYHLYGHCHGQYEHDGKALDVGLDANDFKLCSLNDVRNVLMIKTMSGPY
jgi:calcineurin-like phosphoesterase family protein